MFNLNLKQHSKALVFLATTLLSLSACSADEKIDYELTGRVLDSVTKKPLEGAYVVAVYMGGGSVAGGHSGSWCRKTRGMYTKADGKFNFPVEDRGALNPTLPVAIKPGYGAIDYDLRNENLVMTDKKGYYTDQNLLLTPQDPVKPNLNFQSGETFCSRAKSKQDAAAGATFYKIILAERIKYGAPAFHIKVAQDIIDRLESLP
jgi:hypothetical protein